MTRPWRVLGAALLVALAMQFAGVRFAASQSLTLSARSAPVVSTDDPWDAVWDGSSVLDLALSAQTVTAPKGGTRELVRARALHDDRRLYVLLEWSDATRDVAIDRVTSYTDAAALQLPAASTTGVPPLCMGSLAQVVNIWQWKAAWQADVEKDMRRVASSWPRADVQGYPFADDAVFAPARALGNLVARAERTSPVEDLHAGQYGTLTTAAAQPVGGIGVWRSGTWRVLFWRDLAPSQEDDARFAVGAGAVDAAAALWDGAEKERDGMKAVSQFFAIRPVTAPVGIAAPFWTRALIVVLPMLVFVAVIGLLARSGWVPLAR